MIINVNVRTSDTRNTIMVDSSTTVKELLETSGVTMASGQTSIDGVTIRADDLNKTLESMGYDGSSDTKSRMYLMNIAKQDNAAV